MSNMELISKVRELKELEALQEELTTELDAIRDTLKAHMAAIGTEEISVDVYKVRYKTFSNNRVDTAALKKELPDVAVRFTKTTVCRRFSVA